MLNEEILIEVIDDKKKRRRRRGKRGRRGRRGKTGFQGPPGATGPAGPAGPAGLEVLTNQTYYVDAQYGDDGTGEPFNRNKPYQTITAAMNAAVTSGLNSTIHVWPGTYTDANLGVTDGNNIDYFFEEGVILTPDDFLFPDISYLVVRGNAVIVGGEGLTNQFMLCTIDEVRTLVFECKSITWNASNVFLVTAGPSSEPLSIKIWDRIESTTTLGELTDNNMSAMSFGCGGNGATFSCPYIIKTNGSVFRMTDGLVTNPGNDSGWKVDVGHIELVSSIAFLSVGNTPIHANVGELHTSTNFGGYQLAIIYTSSTTSYVDVEIGNVYIDSAGDPITFISNTGKVYYRGRTFTIADHGIDEDTTLINVLDANQYTSVEIDRVVCFNERFILNDVGESRLVFGDVIYNTTGNVTIFQYASGDNYLEIRNRIVTGQFARILYCYGGNPTVRINIIESTGQSTYLFNFTIQDLDINVDMKINAIITSDVAGILTQHGVGDAGYINGTIDIGYFSSSQRLLDLQDASARLVFNGVYWRNNNGAGGGDYVMAITTSPTNATNYTFNVGVMECSATSTAIYAAGGNYIANFNVGRVLTSNGNGVSVAGTGTSNFNIGYMSSSVYCMDIAGASGSVVTYNVNYMTSQATALYVHGESTITGRIAILSSATGIEMDNIGTSIVTNYIGMMSTYIYGIRHISSVTTAISIYNIDYAFCGGDGSPFYVGLSPSNITLNMRMLLCSGDAFTLLDEQIIFDANIQYLTANNALLSDSETNVRFNADYGVITTRVAEIGGLNPIDVIVSGHYQVTACPTSMIHISAGDGATVRGIYYSVDNTKLFITGTAQVRYYNVFSNVAVDAGITAMIAGSVPLINANVK